MIVSHSGTLLCTIVVSHSGTLLCTIVVSHSGTLLYMWNSEPFWHARTIIVSHSGTLLCTIIVSHSGTLLCTIISGTLLCTIVVSHSGTLLYMWNREPFWHARTIIVSHSGTLLCTIIVSHSGTLLYMYYHSEPFWHAPMYYRSEPFWHAPTCGIASYSAAIIVSPPMTPAHALLRVYREQLLQRMAFKYVRFRKRVIIYLLLFSLFPSPEKDNDPGEQAECRKACRCSSYRCTLVIARTIARLGFIPLSLR